jgi:hypothetical protein
MAGWIAHSMLHPAVGRSWPQAIGIAIGVLLTSAAVGKLLGLALARIRLLIAMRELRVLCAWRYVSQKTAMPCEVIQTIVKL